jgi:glucose/arabinose dehydrogenase
MLKKMIRFMILTGLVLVGAAGFWLLSQTAAEPAQAKAVVGAASFLPWTNPSARPMSAGFVITVSQVIAQGLSRPVQVTHAGDNSGRLFVVEQDGRIKIIKSGTVLGTAFLNISGLVRSPADGAGDEEGLLGLAFHPNYETNGYFYVYYNNTGGNIVVARYQVSPSDPDQADPSSGLIVLPIAHPSNDNHNGGQLAFSPIDGYLYLGTGDGGGGGDPNRNAQNKNVLLGKILRLNVTGATTYTIPAGNPFQGATAGADEIWAVGLRNPFRFSFDRATGDLYIGDVGQGEKEEVDYQAVTTPGGVNFGWSCREGTTTFNTDSPCNSSTFLATLTNPIAEYDHSNGRAVSGGVVYRGVQYPDLNGYYFYADFYSGKIWSMHKTESTFSAPELKLTTSLNISAFGEDEAGEVYVVDYSGGRIRRLAEVSGPNPDPNALLIYLPLIFK